MMYLRGVRPFLNHCICNRAAAFLWKCHEAADLCHERRLSLIKKKGKDADIYCIKCLYNWESVLFRKEGRICRLR